MIQCASVLTCLEDSKSCLTSNLQENILNLNASSLSEMMSGYVHIYFTVLYFISFIFGSGGTGA